MALGWNTSIVDASGIHRRTLSDSGGTKVSEREKQCSVHILYIQWYKWHCTLPNDLFDHDAVLHSILPASYKIVFQLPINRLFHPLYLYTTPPKERLYKCTQKNNSISHQEAAFATSKFGQNDDLVYCTQKPMYNSDQLIKVLNRVTNDCMLSSFSLSCLMSSARFWSSVLLAWEISATHLALDSEISPCNEEMVASSVVFEPMTSAMACIVGVRGVPMLPKLFCLLSLLGEKTLSMPPLPVIAQSTIHKDIWILRERIVAEPFSSQ